MAAGLEAWVQDVMRHSFASNWLAEHGDINRLTLQMGHESTDMLFRHYNRTCKRKDAAKYWQIMPSPSARGRKIVSNGRGVVCLFLPLSRLSRSIRSRLRLL